MHKCIKDLKESRRSFWTVVWMKNKELMKPSMITDPHKCPVVLVNITNCFGKLTLKASWSQTHLPLTAGDHRDRSSQHRRPGTQIGKNWPLSIKPAPNASSETLKSGSISHRCSDHEHNASLLLFSVLMFRACLMIVYRYGKFLSKSTWNI